jgi:hypothetical protein
MLPLPAVIAMKGNFMLGMNLVFVKLYPMRPGTWAWLSVPLLQCW